MSESKEPQDSVGGSRSSVCHPPTYFPLGGKLDGDCAFIMVRRRGQSHDETLGEWKMLMQENGIILGEGDVFGFPDEPWDDLLMAKDYERFEQVMAQARWKKQFIAFGP